jgi:alkylhydroperoxidase family enzyme
MSAALGDEKLVERVARAIRSSIQYEVEPDVRANQMTDEELATVARAALALARPVIREECARVADDQAKVFKDEAHDQKIWGSPAMSKRALAIANYFEKHAAAIRAME